LGYPGNWALPSAAVLLFPVKHPPASEQLTAYTTASRQDHVTRVNQSELIPPLGGQVCPCTHTHSSRMAHMGTGKFVS